MQKQAWTWTTSRWAQPARLVRWGHFGMPVLIFPTAGGDFEEIERFHLISALNELLERGRMKAYSVDGLWARAWLSTECAPAPECTPDRSDDESLPHHSFLYEEVLPRIREDCQDPRIEPILAGASRGAAVAVGTLCRYPDSFRAAVGISGVYQIAPATCGTTPTPCGPLAPLSCLAQLTGRPLERLRQRTIILGSGEGEYEDPADAQHLANARTAKGVACRMTLWGAARDHTWSTWREMFPSLLAEQL
jgi:esterase/lipase superfamily enzyme